MRIESVNIDLSMYEGKDVYSDGDIEDELLDLVRTKNEMEILSNDNRWPVLYHLSPIRRNILSWFPFVEV